MKTGDWYFGAVGTAAEYGLITGRGNDCFDPLANISRQEAMAMIQRAASVAEFAGGSGSLAGFADTSELAPWANDAAEFSVGSGLIKGSDGKLNPSDSITRAESATVILRLLQKAQLVDVRSNV